MEQEETQTRLSAEQAAARLADGWRQSKMADQIRFRGGAFQTTRI